MQIKELLASSDEEEDIKPAKPEKSYVPKITGRVTWRFDLDWGLDRGVQIAALRLQRLTQDGHVVLQAA